MQEIISLLKHLISIPSISRNETEKADYLEHYLLSQDCAVNRIGNNIWCMANEYDSTKKTILLNSHIDTVKPNESWTFEPHNPTQVDDKIYGLGSNDAHASVVSLIATFLHLKDKQLLYNLVLGLSCQEEISGKDGVELLLTKLPKIDFAIVGEPTQMQMAIAEKGLMVLDCEAKGVSGHAARNEGVNAIYKAIDAIKWVENYKFDKVSETLGEVKMTVTIVNAGTQHNVVPDSCKFTIDVRLTDCYTHQEVFDIVDKNIDCDVNARSMRLRPSGVAKKHKFVSKFIENGGEVFGSSTMSDQALMAFDSVKIGPGDSARSHTADEFICASEIKAGIQTYIDLLKDFEF